MRFRTFSILAMSLVYVGILAVWINRMVPRVEIDKDLEPYYAPFMHAVERNCYMREFNLPNQISISFDNLPRTKDGDHVVGSCRQNPLKFEVRIDVLNWNLLSEADKYQLMFHELGHCVLNLDHVTSSTSIMYPELMPMSMFQSFYQAEAMIKQNCTLWEKSNGFAPIKE